MVDNLKGSRTEENLKTALQGEALAHLKYQFYRSKISEFSKDFEAKLDEIVHNEKEHGKIWFKLLHDGAVPNDSVNLLDAMLGEKYEAEEMYPEFARIAREEGFEEIAELFEGVAEIEANHESEFEVMKKCVEDESFVFSDDNLDTRWKCLNCGYVVVGGFPPEVCPVCSHPRKYFVKL